MVTSRFFWHRWRINSLCVRSRLLPCGSLTPAQTDVTQKVGSYTATVTLVVGADGSADDTEAPTPISLARIALYVTTGEIPRLAAESLG